MRGWLRRRGRWPAVVALSSVLAWVHPFAFAPLALAVTGAFLVFEAPSSTAKRPASFRDGSDTAFVWAPLWVVSASFTEARRVTRALALIVALRLGLYVACPLVVFSTRFVFERFALLTGFGEAAPFAQLVAREGASACTESRARTRFASQNPRTQPDRK